MAFSAVKAMRLVSSLCQETCQVQTKSGIFYALQENPRFHKLAATRLRLISRHKRPFEASRGSPVFFVDTVMERYQRCPKLDGKLCTPHKENIEHRVHIPRAFFGICYSQHVSFVIPHSTGLETLQYIVETNNSRLSRTVSRRKI